MRISCYLSPRFSKYLLQIHFGKLLSVASTSFSSIVVLLIQVDEAFDFSAKGVDGGKDENAWGPMYIIFSLPCTIWMSCDQYF